MSLEIADSEIKYQRSISVKRESATTGTMNKVAFITILGGDFEVLHGVQVLPGKLGSGKNKKSGFFSTGLLVHLEDMF